MSHVGTSGQFGRLGALFVLGVAAVEVIIMVSPFAGFFYARLQFEPFLGFLSTSPLTAWLDGFFLNHSVVTRSLLLEWHRRIGLLLFLLGTLGFLVSAAQVYGGKILKLGVADTLLYKYIRHPQYFCLGIAGYGLLVGWPRFLLLGVWVTMMFLYAWLARFEGRRMEERFGEEYRAFAATRGSFLPASPVHRLFEASFGLLRPRALGWGTAYVFCLSLAFSLGFAARGYTRANSAIVFRPDHGTVVVSAWPQPEEWVSQVYEAALADAEVQQRLEESRGEAPVVATILPPRYGMRAMFYKPSEGRALGRGGRINGVDPDSSDEPVELVFSRASKPYKEGLALEEALDVSVRLTPVLVVEVVPGAGTITDIHVPLPQNAWGPSVVMPIL